MYCERSLGRPPAGAGFVCPCALSRQGHASLVVYSPDTESVKRSTKVAEAGGAMHRHIFSVCAVLCIDSILSGVRGRI